MQRHSNYCSAESLQRLCVMTTRRGGPGVGGGHCLWSGFFEGEVGSVVARARKERREVEEGGSGCLYRTVLVVELD